MLGLVLSLLVYRLQTYSMDYDVETKGGGECNNTIVWISGSIWALIILVCASTN